MSYLLRHVILKIDAPPPTPRAGPARPRGRWWSVAARARGTSHAAGGTPCQDHLAATVCHRGGREFLVAAVSDGAGSAARAAEGSAEACRLVRELMVGWATGTGEAPAEEQVYGWAGSVHAGLERLAGRLGCPLADLHCTLHAVLVADEWAAFLHLGDGVICIDGEADDAAEAEAVGGLGMRPAFAPMNGEYVNTTFFITQPSWNERLNCGVARVRLADVLLTTDGLTPLFLTRGGEVHRPFIDPLLARLRATAPAAIEDQVAAFLDSPRVNARTDDDKSLVLAVRLDEGGSQG